MKKREAFFLLSVLLVLFGYIFFFLSQGFPSIYQGFNKANSNLVGNAISNFKVPYLNIDLTLIIFIFQGIILGFIIFAVIMRAMKKTKQKSENINLGSISLKKTKSQTDLDLFYNIIKEKKKIGIGVIAKYFNIENEKALEWAKILENEEMVTIDYPFLNNPEISYIENEPLENKPFNEKVSKNDEKQPLEINLLEKGFQKPNKPFNEKVSKDENEELNKKNDIQVKKDEKIESKTKYKHGLERNSHIKNAKNKIKHKGKKNLPNINKKKRRGILNFLRNR